MICCYCQSDKTGCVMNTCEHWFCMNCTQFLVKHSQEKCPVCADSMFLTIDEDSFIYQENNSEEVYEVSNIDQMIESVYQKLIYQRNLDLALLEEIRCSFDFINAEVISNELIQNLNGEVLDQLGLVKKFSLNEFDRRHNIDYIDSSLAEKCLENISEIAIAREKSFFNEEICWLGTKLSFCNLTLDGGFCKDNLKITSTVPILLKGIGFGASFSSEYPITIESFTIFLGDEPVYADNDINLKPSGKSRLTIKHIFRESVILDSDTEYSLKYQIKGKKIYIFKDIKFPLVYKNYEIRIGKESDAWTMFLIFDQSK